MRLNCLLLVLATFAFGSCETVKSQEISLPVLSSNMAALPFIGLVGTGEIPNEPKGALPLRVGIMAPVSVPNGKSTMRSILMASSKGQARRRATMLVFGSLSERERKLTDAWAERGVAAGQISHYEYIPSILADKSQTNALDVVRSAAKARDLDAVLVLRFGRTVRTSPTVFSVFDLLILPAFIIPSTRVEAMAVFEGALLDVETGYPFAIGSAEAVNRSYGPGFSTNLESHARKARRDALKTMLARLSDSVSPGAEAGD